MTVFNKKPFMYRLGARLFEWMRSCALYKFHKDTGTLVHGKLFDPSMLKGKWRNEWRNEEECKNENSDTEM